MRGSDQAALRQPRPRTGAWTLEDAKARFSEVVRLARETGPQHATVRGREAVVVLSAVDYARSTPEAASPSLVVLFGEGPFARLDDFGWHLVREQAPARDAPDF